MFHRQKTEAENSVQSQPQGAANRAPQPAEKAPIQNFVKTEKEKGMYQNQGAQAAQNEESSDKDSTSRPIDIPGAPAGNAQRPMQPRMPGAFPGSSYSPNPASGPAFGASPSAKAQPEGRRLVVGEGISLSGEIEACDVLIVEGTIEAALKGARTLDIAESGVFYGTVEIEEATVAGRFEGELTVNGRLTIRSSGSITGSISYKELAVEAGAVLDGKVTPLSAGKLEKKPDGSRPAQVKKPASRDVNLSSELPFNTGTKASAGA